MSSLLIAVDAPRNPQIVPRQSTYKPGDRIHCSAEGNPAPSYQWTDLVSETVIQGAVLVIGEDMVNNYHAFQCTATNQYNSVSSTLTFTAEGMKPLTVTTFTTVFGNRGRGVILPPIVFLVISPVYEKCQQRHLSYQWC